MKIGITSKLFLALLATCLMVIILMSLTMRITFDRGLLDYVNMQDISRTSVLTKILADNYSEHGGWQWLREDGRHWGQLLREKYGPPPFNPPKSLESQKNDSKSNNLPPDQLNLAPRATVLDEQQRYVTGNMRPADNAARKPIEVDGTTVGWLLISPYTALTDAMAVTFRNQESHVIYIIAGISLFLAVIVAILLARTFLAPVRRLATGMHSLSSGDYLQTIPVTSQDEMGRLAQDFNRLAYTLQKNDQARRQWIADISHELRTPLAILRGEIEAMQDGVRPIATENISSLHAEIMMLSKLVNDLYDLSMSDVGALAYRKQHINVLAVLERSLSTSKEMFRNKDIAIESLLDSNSEAILFADETRLSQLFVNLLQNVARYTTAGGKLRISSERKEGKIDIDFHDTPPGVPKEALPHLFERLYRVDETRNRENGGAGLGLAICKNIVEAHGGSIAAKPSPLGGLWIHVTFPLES